MLLANKIKVTSKNETKVKMFLDTSQTRMI